MEHLPYKIIIIWYINCIIWMFHIVSMQSIEHSRYVAHISANVRGNVLDTNFVFIDG